MITICEEMKFSAVPPKIISRKYKIFSFSDIFLLIMFFKNQFLGYKCTTMVYKIVSKILFVYNLSLCRH